MSRPAVRAATAMALAALLALSTGCIGSGKTARSDEIGALPTEFSVVYDAVASCRNGESGFDYRFLVIRGDTDLSPRGPFLAALRANGFTWSNPVYHQLPWTTVTYQHVINPDGTPYALALEIGPLDAYLADPVSYTGPDPAALPAEARDDPDGFLLVAMRPTDFLCSTPL